MTASRNTQSKQTETGRWSVKEVASQSPKKSASTSIGRDAATGQFLVAASKADELKKRGFSSDEIHSIVAPRRTLAEKRREKV